MNQDPLAKFARALAEEKDGATAAPSVTRSRVLASVARNSKKRKLRLAWHAPIWVLLFGTTAWASQNAPLRRWIATRFESSRLEIEGSKPPFPGSGSVRRFAKERENDPSEASESASSSLDAHASEKAASVERTAGDESTVPSLAPPRASSKTIGTTPAHSLVAPRNEATSAPIRGTSSSPDSGGLALYRRAHDAQFRNADYRSALADYESYLASEPRGSFVPEARYNIALCLVHLGRYDEAKRALGPFSNGNFGDYRRARAVELLDALEKH